MTPPLHVNPFARGSINSITMGASSADWTAATVTINTTTGSGFSGLCAISGGGIATVIVLDSGEGYLGTDTPVFTGDGTSAMGILVVGPQTGTYPGVVEYYQQRRIYANTLNLPDTFWGSQPGAFTNFDRAIPIADSDAITATPSAQQVEGIQWIVSMPLGMVMFTGAGVLQVGASGSVSLSSPGALTPSNIVAVPQNSIGSSEAVRPIRINWDILYLETHGATIRDLTYQIFFNNYIGADISWQSSHLLTGHKLIDWTWCMEPYRIVWMVRDDGALLSLTYLKEQEVTGIARHDTQGLVRSVCSVTEIPVDALYLVTQRLAGTRYYIERMDNRIWSSVEDAWCVDCGVSLPQPTLNASVVADKGNGTGAAFTTLPGVFGAGDVGKVLRMGGGIALMTAFVGPTRMIGNWIYPCQQIVPNDAAGTTQSQLPGAWTLTQPVSTVNGLEHLAGQTVTGLADGIPITPRVVNAGGSITLDRAASSIVIGLGFTAQAQSLYLETGQPTIQGRRKVIPSVIIRTDSSGVLQCGTNQADASAQNPSPLFENWTLPPAPTPTDLPPTYQTPSGGTVRPLYTGDIYANMSGDWRRPGQVAVQQTLPLPMAITALIPNILPGDIPETDLPPRRPAPQQQGRAA